MLDDFAAVERALRRYTDAYQPRSASVLAGVVAPKGNDQFPFAPALLDDLEVRSELRVRMAFLDTEQVHVLVRWYVEGVAAATIAGGLGRSLRHVYRVRTRAVERIVELGHADEFDDADLAEFV
jgi:DNA-directed RNA polymerase specialized sigma24 family protein